MKFNLGSAKDLKELAKKLMAGLTKLNFEDNVEHQLLEDKVIIAGSTVSIENKLTFIPSKYIIVSQEGNGLVTKTGTWTNKTMYLKNNGAQNVTISVLFMR